MSKRLKVALAVILAIVIGAAFLLGRSDDTAVASFEECGMIGVVNDDSCRMNDGKVFVKGMADHSFELRGTLERTRKSEQWGVRVPSEGEEGRKVLHILAFVEGSTCLSGGREQLCTEMELPEGSSVFVKGRQGGKNVEVDVLLVL